MTLKDRLHRQTKILATLGPASRSPEMLAQLVEAGVNVFRLNFSHGSHEDHANAVKLIRDLEEKIGTPIGILADMQGPKLRIGTFENDAIDIEKGMVIRFDLDKTPGNKTRVCLPHEEIISVLEVGSYIFMDDGKVRAKITEKGSDFVNAEIMAGSKLSNRKGVNVPDVVIPIPALTEKDRIDLAAALDMDVDWVAQSFVQTAEDVAEARELIQGRAKLMVKIEKPSALEHLEAIVDLADGVMLARGDLGVEIPAEDVPSVQKRVVRMVREKGKPIVVATQMLESMIESPRPTRAEASDVATAVYDGADTVMLSAETAAGAYPVQAVEFMNRICTRTEHDGIYRKIINEPMTTIEDDISAAITCAARTVAKSINAALIVTYTTSGTTALRTAKHRPEVPVLSITPDLKAARQLTLSYGINPIHAPETIDDFTGPAQHASEIIRKLDLAPEGKRFVMTAGVPFGKAGTTNILRVAVVS